MYRAVALSTRKLWNRIKRPFLVYSAQGVSFARSPHGSEEDSNIGGYGDYSKAGQWWLRMIV